MAAAATQGDTQNAKFRYTYSAMSRAQPVSLCGGYLIFRGEPGPGPAPWKTTYARGGIVSLISVRKVAYWEGTQGEQR